MTLLLFSSIFLFSFRCSFNIYTCTIHPRTLFKLEHLLQIHKYSCFWVDSPPPKHQNIPLCTSLQPVSTYLEVFNLNPCPFFRTNATTDATLTGPLAFGRGGPGSCTGCGRGGGSRRAGHGLGSGGLETSGEICET